MCSLSSGIVFRPGREAAELRVIPPPPSVPLRSDIMAADGWLMVTVGPVRLRHEVPTEVDFAAPSFKAALALTTGNTIALTRELLTAAAVQLQPLA